MLHPGSPAERAPACPPPMALVVVVATMTIFRTGCHHHDIRFPERGPAKRSRPPNFAVPAPSLRGPGSLRFASPAPLRVPRAPRFASRGLTRFASRAPAASRPRPHPHRGPGPTRFAAPGTLP